MIESAAPSSSLRGHVNLLPLTNHSELGDEQVVYSDLYSWRKYELNKTTDVNTSTSNFRPIKKPLASEFTNQTVYLSMASTSFRIHSVHKVLTKLFEGFIWPDHLYLFLSTEPFLLDAGVSESDISDSLKEMLLIYPMSIIFTDNIGAHRKLLPLLARHWQDDIVIVTVDDDTLYAPKFLQSFIKTYIKSNRQAVVASRTRRISFCNEFPHVTMPYVYWTRQHCDTVKNELLVLPTGVGGVLYRPQFLHEIIFEAILRDITKYNDDMHFRIASLIHRVPVYTACVGASVKYSFASDNSENLPTLVDNNQELFSHNKNKNSKMWNQAMDYVLANYMHQHDLAFMSAKAILPDDNMESSRRSVLRTPRGLPGLISETIGLERNLSACADTLNVAFTVEKAFRTENACGVYTCSKAHHIIREVTNDDPVQALINMAFVSTAVLLFLLIHICCKGLVKGKYKGWRLV